MVPEADSCRREASAADIKAYDLTIAGGCGQDPAKLSLTGVYLDE